MAQYAVKDNKTLEIIDFGAIEEKLIKKIPIFIRASFKANGWNHTVDNTILTTYNKQWKFRFVDEITCNSSSVLASIRAKGTTKTKYYNDSALGVSDIGEGDYYSVEQSTWLCFAADTSMSCVFGSDDEGCAFLNDSYLGAWSSCSSATFTCNFKKGWNLLTICWHEIAGAAYGYCTTKFNTLVGNGTVLYQCAEPPFNLYQEVTVSLGETKTGDNLMYLMATDTTIANYLSEKATITVGTNKIKYTLPRGANPTFGPNKFNNVDCDILFIK